MKRILNILIILGCCWAVSRGEGAQDGEPLPKPGTVLVSKERGEVILSAIELWDISQRTKKQAGK
ncbi:MAG TPA: hypothetical protein VEL76_03305 [Gemmataceae bacterium]|nr:hypothetical protein [Gemmataceae bacterium]